MATRRRVLLLVLLLAAAGVTLFGAVVPSLPAPEASLATVTPLRTVLRVQGQQTDNERILSSNQENITFNNAATDPRHLYGLGYLLRNNLAGAINPDTGQPWPIGSFAAPQRGPVLEGDAVRARRR